MADDEPSDVTDDEPSPPTSLTGRLSQTFFRPPKPKPEDDEGPLTDAELKRRITMLDPTERKLGNFAALLAAIVSVLLTWRGVSNPKLAVPKPTKPGRNHSCPSNYQYAVVHGKGTCLGILHSSTYWTLLLVIMLLFALAMFVTTRIGRRAPLGFAAAMTGLAYDTQVGILGLPFLIFGGWLLVRAYRVQKWGTTNSKEAAQKAGEARAARKAGTAPPASAGGSRTQTRRGKKDSTPPGARVAPSPNKRYTPKAPPKKKVTPPPSS